MFWFWATFVGLQCVLLLVLARTGGKLLRKEREEAEALLAFQDGDWPSAALIIPVAGTHPRMADALRSLLSQDYPRLIPILVTAEADEPAAGLIHDLQKKFPTAQHLVAGRAERCGQKNHNSLQAISFVGDAADVYVFCDSTHLARPDFVRQLVAPIARGEASFSTGYHYVAPGDRRQVTLAYAQSVLLMRLLQAVLKFTQPWGGGMAASREAFARLGVARHWARNVVDDCSLAGLLLQRGERVRLCPGALLRTEAQGHARQVWRAWMDRQVLFLKFCMPGQWLLLGFLALIMFVPPFGAALAVLGGLMGVTSGGIVLMALVYVGVVIAAQYFWRNFLSRPPSLLHWAIALFRAVGMFALVYVQSIPAKGIVWHGIDYRVGRGGVVRSMRRV